MTEGVIGNLFIQRLYEKWALGSWSNQAHLSLQHVDHLGNLIDPQFADNFSYLGDPGIILCGPNRTNISFRALGHRAKFIDDKWFFMLPHPFLTIEDRTRTIQFNRGCCE